jgi:hypothetical protein
MAFFKLNGWAVPIAQAQEDTLDIGTSERAYSGIMRRTRLALKRQWTITTTDLLQEDGIALEGMLLARGQQFIGELDTFSAKGLPTLQDNGISTVIGQGKYGNAWWPRGAFTNLLADNIATGTDALGTTAGFGVSSLNGGYSAVDGGGTVVSSTAQAWQGTRSAYVSLLSGGLHFGGIYHVATVAPNTQYTWSCYVKGEAAATLQLYAYGPNNAGVTINSGNAPFGVTASAWARPALTFTTGPGVTSVRLIMGEYADAGYKFYTDAWLLEPGSAASPFSLNFAGVNVGYDVTRDFATGAEAASISGWAINPSLSGNLAALASSQNTASVRLYYSATNVMRMRVTNDLGVYQDVAVSWSNPSTYNLWTAALTQTGSPNMWLYKNGVLVGSGTHTTPPTIAKLDRFYLGNFNGAGTWGGYLDEVMMYPFAATSSMLKGLVSLTSAPPLQPQLILDGDIVASQPAQVLPSEVKTTYTEGRKSVGWRDNLARVQFTLTEA